MEINWSIIGWITAIIFVYIFGIYEGRSQGRKRRIAEEQEEKNNQPASPPETIQVDDPGLLRIKNENGVLSLDLDGTRVDTSSLSSNQRKRLIEILSVMRPWVEGKPTPPATLPPVSTPTFESRLGAVSAPPPAPAPNPVSKASPVPASPTPTSKRDEKSETKPTSMVGQINAILQQRIANTELSAPGIALMESASGGVNVYVGINKYEGIEDVPSEEVKAAIRAAITEWEKKYTPGLS
jgi:hypothetical protein